MSLALATKGRAVNDGTSYSTLGYINIVSGAGVVYYILKTFISTAIEQFAHIGSHARS